MHIFDVYLCVFMHCGTPDIFYVGLTMVYPLCTFNLCIVPLWKKKTIYMQSEIILL